MFPGFNTEIDCDNLRYHIQTEVLGARDPAILTLVYRAGAIVNRVKRNYLEVLGEHPTDEEIRFLAERQHRRVIDKIQGSRQDVGGTEPAVAPPDEGAARGQAEEESLDQLILDYLDAKGGQDSGQASPPSPR